MRAVFCDATMFDCDDEIGVLYCSQSMSDNDCRSSSSRLNMYIIYLIIDYFFVTLSNASWTICSLWESRADVASSNRRIFGSRITALAIAMRCFSPPDNWVPLSPTRV